MPSTPPRRRAQRPASGDDAGLPLIPILIGVIVLGFVIGAGWSLLSNRHGPRAADVAVSGATSQPDSLPTVTPVPAPSPSPAATVISDATPAATHTPKPVHTPMRAPTPKATVSALPLPTATAGAAASSEQPAASTTAPAVALAKRAAKDVPPPPPPVIAAPAHATAPPVTSGPTAAPATGRSATAAAAPVNSSSDFDRLAGAVVRQYLEAVKRGDTTAAYAALGAAPGDHGVSLTESGVVDARTRIGRIDSHGTADTATVEVDLQTPAGPYYGEYTVRKNDTGAAVIVQHSLVKP